MNDWTNAYRHQVLAESAHHLEEIGETYAEVMNLVGNASVVLLGEASHGTHEFYDERAKITKLLIKQKGFTAVAIEGDWPDAYRVHRYVNGANDDFDAADALSGFTCFPSWLWANAVLLNFVGWLRDFNEAASEGKSISNSVGFYGLDLYSLYRSAQEVIDYLESVDAAAAERARHRYACFEQFGHDVRAYARTTALRLSASCEEKVVAQLVEILSRRIDTHTQGYLDPQSEGLFNAEQNSRLGQAAEHYYRTMMDENVSSWNLRDQHMMNTLVRIRTHLKDKRFADKIIVWAHNSHIGDARATSMGSRRGEWNLGQLARQKYGPDVIAIGFTTYDGHVTAASRWDGRTERKAVTPALAGSYEQLFHQLNIPRFFLNLRTTAVAQILSPSMLQRAIGVLYLPETERFSHYLQASLPKQFDGVIHIDHTRAVEPLEHTLRWQPGEEVPETYPRGQ